MLTLILTVALSGAPKGVDAKLVGTWLAGNEPFVTFNANGTGQMDEGKIKWSADGKTLVVTDDEGTADKATYTLDGDTLTLTMGGMPIPLTRAGAGVQVKKQGALAAKANKAQNAMSDEEAEREAMAMAQEWMKKNGQGQAPQQQQPQQGWGQQQQPQMQQPQARQAGTDQLSQLLLSSSWCSFTYNKISGASNTTKVTFYANGQWGLGSRGETYSSGQYGTVAGQHDSTNGGQWAVQNGQLLMSGGQYPQLTPIPDFRVYQNSNGYPIIFSMGKEYSRCN